MDKFTNTEYALIELANQWGLDKLPWKERINFQIREDWKEAENPVQYLRALNQYKELVQGKPTNATISLDATASGLQHIAILGGCRKTAQLCNVIGNVRNDAYTIIHEATKLPHIPRKDCKKAIMQSAYGGTKTAKLVYGEDLPKFYQALDEEAPAVIPYVDLALSAWNSKTLTHSWIMPDNFHVDIPVEVKRYSQVKFMGSIYEITKEVNAPKAKDKSLAANIIHSLDSLVVRELIARCSNRIQVLPDDQLIYRLDELAELTGFKSARILYYRDDDKDFMLPEKPFNILPVHDCFKVLLPYANDLRMQYNQIMYEIANSRVLDFILWQITKTPWRIDKDTSWTSEILSANYSLS